MMTETLGTKLEDWRQIWALDRWKSYCQMSKALLLAANCSQGWKIFKIKLKYLTKTRGLKTGAIKPAFVLSGVIFKINQPGDHLGLQVKKQDDCRHLWTLEEILSTFSQIQVDGTCSQNVVESHCWSQTWSSSRKITSQDKTTWSEDAYSSIVLDDNAAANWLLNRPQFDEWPQNTKAGNETFI
jgi:hypothetical protein